MSSHDMMIRLIALDVLTFAIGNHALRTQKCGIIKSDHLDGAVAALIFASIILRVPHFDDGRVFAMLYF